MKMNKKINLEEMVAYDFSNLDLQENSNNNCFGCDSSDCDCDTCCDNCD